jgi:hypothetical protein
MQFPVDQVHPQYVGYGPGFTFPGVRVGHNGLAVGLQNGGQVRVSGGRQKTPVEGVVHEPARIFAHDLRRILAGIEAETDEAYAGGVLGAVQNPLLQAREHMRGQRAPVDLGAAAVDKAEDDDLVAHQFVQGRGASIAVDHRTVTGHAHRRESVAAGDRRLELEIRPAWRQYFRSLIRLLPRQHTAAEKQQQKQQQNQRTPGALTPPPSVYEPGMQHTRQWAASCLCPGPALTRRGCDLPYSA